MKEAAGAIDKFQPLWGFWKVEEIIGQKDGCEVYKAYKEEWGKKYTSTVKHMSFNIGRSDIKEAKAIGIDEASMLEYYKSVVGSVLNEIELMYRLRGNSNIVTYEDHMIYQKKDDLGWDVLIRMEYLQPLPDFLAGQELGRNEAVRLGIDICKALEACAREGIMHRDIKDSSIFVSPKGEYKLGSFSLAKELDKGGRIVSSSFNPLYMAPELYKEQSYDYSVDIYSLGIVMYKLLNRGRLPFMPLPPEIIKVEDTETSITNRMAGAELPLPVDAGEGLGAIILKACSYDRKDRYKSPDELRQKLERLLKAEARSSRGDCRQTTSASECAAAKDDFTETPLPIHEGEADTRTAYEGELERLAVVELVTSIDKMNNARRLAEKKLIRNIGIGASMMVLAFVLAFFSAYEVTPPTAEITANIIKATPAPTSQPASSPALTQMPAEDARGEEYYKQGLEHIKNRQYALALSAFEEAKRLGYDEKEADSRIREINRSLGAQRLYKKAAAYYEQKDYEKAIAAFGELARTDSKYKNNAQYADSFFQLAASHNSKGMKYFNEGKPELSVKEFDAALGMLESLKNNMKEYDFEKYSKLQSTYSGNKSRLLEKMHRVEECFALAAEYNKAGVEYCTKGINDAARRKFESALDLMKEIRLLVPNYSSNGYEGLIQIYEANLSRAKR